MHCSCYLFYRIETVIYLMVPLNLIKCFRLYVFIEYVITRHTFEVVSMLQNKNVLDVCNTMGSTARTGTTYPCGTANITSSFKRGSCASIFSFLWEMFCSSFFVHLFFFFLYWSVDLRLLVSRFVSSNFSYNHGAKNNYAIFMLVRNSLLMVLIQGTNG